MTLWYDYDGASALTGYKPSYLKWLCTTGKLAYRVKHYRYGRFMRRYREMSVPDLVAFLQTHNRYRNVG